MKHADAAMYLANKEGRNRYGYVTAAMAAEVAARFILESKLRSALPKGQFMLYYQPKIRLIDGPGTGFEALLRWQHPERGPLRPAEFIHVAEECVLMPDHRMGGLYRGTATSALV